MTLNMFVGLLVVFGVLTTSLTDLVKRQLDAQGKAYAANVVALAVAAVVGIGGTAIFYSLRGIAFTGINIECMVLMGVAVWFGSMLGYDKVTQLIAQLANIDK